jgi:hypothetical protein
MHRVSTVEETCFHPAILARAQYIHTFKSFACGMSPMPVGNTVYVISTGAGC